MNARADTDDDAQVLARALDLEDRCHALLAASPAALAVLNAVVSATETTRGPRAERTPAALDAATDLSPAELAQARALWTEAEALRWGLLPRYERRIAQLARQIARHCLLTEEDLQQEGRIGALRGMRRFDPERGVPFQAINAWSRAAMTRAVEAGGRAIRLPSNATEQRRHLLRLREQLRTDGLPHDEAVLARELQLDLRRVRVLLNYTGNLASLDAPITEDSATTLGERLVDEDGTDPLSQAIEAEAITISQAALDLLSPEDRELLCRRFGLRGHEPHGLRSLGAQLGLSRERARQLVNAALGRMRTHMEAATPTLPPRAPAQTSPSSPAQESPVNAPRKTSSTAREDVLASIKAHPGSTPAEIAARLGIRSTNAKTTIARLRKEGLVKPHDRKQPGKCWAFTARTLPPACPIHPRAPVIYSGVCNACMTAMRGATEAFLLNGHLPALSTNIARAYLIADLSKSRGSTVRTQRKIQRLLLDVSLEQAADSSIPVEAEDAIESPPEPLSIPAPPVLKGEVEAEDATESPVVPREALATCPETAPMRVVYSTAPASVPDSVPDAIDEHPLATIRRQMDVIDRLIDLSADQDDATAAVLHHSAGQLAALISEALMAGRALREVV